MTPEQLSAEYYRAIRELGILPKEWDQAAFEAAVAERGLDEALEEAADEESEDWEEYDWQTSRNLFLAALIGVRYDHRFAAAEILLQARRALSLQGVEGLTWGPEDEGRAPDWVRTIDLSLGSEGQLRWAYGTLPGLVQGLNTLLERSSSAVRFQGLETGWDAYAFVCGPPDALDRLVSSPRFLCHSEPDPAARAHPPDGK